MAVVRNREQLKEELKEYFICNCAGKQSIKPHISDALGEPDYTIYSMGGFGDPEAKGREFKVHSWVLADWPYFRNLIQFGGHEVETKTVEIHWEHRLSFPMEGFLRFMYTGHIDNKWTITLVREFGQEFGMKDVDGNLYPFFEIFSPVPWPSWAMEKNDDFCK